MTDLRNAIQFLTGKSDTKVKRSSAAGKTNRVINSYVLSHLSFNFIDIFTRCGDPVFIKCILYPHLFVTVHGRGRQPDLRFERVNACES